MVRAAVQKFTKMVSIYKIESEYFIIIHLQYILKPIKVITKY